VRSFVWSQFRFQRRRAAALGVAVLVAAVGFTLLSAAASTSSLRVHGSLKSSFRPAYDILVRPVGSRTALERTHRLVRPNYLSGIFGGITLKQWQEIERIRGVEVAAPIANLGFMLPQSNINTFIGRSLSSAPYQLYRVTYTYSSPPSQFPAKTVEYVYVTTRDRFSYSESTGIVEKVGPRDLPICDGPYVTGVPAAKPGPFSGYAHGYVWCFSTRSPHSGSSALYRGQLDGQLAAGRPGTYTTTNFPIFVAAIDPVQEDKLLGLKRTLVKGHYLPERGGERLQQRLGFGIRTVPAIASVRTFVSSNVDATVERLRVPAGLLPRALTIKQGYRLFSRLSGQVVAHQRISAGQAYRHLLDSPLPAWGGEYWTPGPVRYGHRGGALVPRMVRNPISIWESNSQSSGYWQAPQANEDVQFRTLTPHVPSNTYHGRTMDLPLLRVVGHFDPDRLPGFNPLSRVPLETYYPPELEPADAVSSRALGGRRFLPTENLGGYVQQPPLLLTSLDGLKSFLNSTLYTGVSPAERRASISVIRVKVAAVTGPDPLSLERIKLVAQEIHAETGLAVDITAGSSPHRMTISLPKGKFGQPKLVLTEGWSKKGVTVSFLRALDRKDLGLFALILVICGFFLGNGTLASVRARRAEIGTLRTLGWPRSAVFSAVMGELAVIGLAAGALGAGLAAAIVSLFSLDLALWRVVLVVPIALGLALVAGLPPAWLAGRGLPLDALRPPVRARSRRRSVRHLVVLALVNLTRVPARTLLGASGLTIGVAALGVLVGIERAFRGTLVGTVLGNAISVQVRGADYAAVGLTIGLAACSLADVVYLNLRERQAELVTLRTLGWSPGHIRQTVLWESLGLGLLGCLAGAVVALLLGTLLLSVPFTSVLEASLLATAGGVLAALVASLLPLSQVNRLSAPATLAAE
jgi:putative ABC transport system permease protein